MNVVMSTPFIIYHIPQLYIYLPYITLYFDIDNSIIDDNSNIFIVASVPILQHDAVI